MKKIGIVGGTAWPSTVRYYSHLCASFDAQHGTTPEFSIESLDLRRAVSYIGDAGEGSWERFDTYHRDALCRLAASGAQIAFFAAVTPHHRFASITAGVPIECIHIVDAIASAAIAGGVREATLLGTRLTMNSEIIRDRFGACGVNVRVPPPDQQNAVAHAIERIQSGEGVDRASILEHAPAGGALILGCTELTLAFPDSVDRPRFIENGVHCLNALAIHAGAVADACAR